MSSSNLLSITLLSSLTFYLNNLFFIYCFSVLTNQFPSHVPSLQVYASVSSPPVSPSYSISSRFPPFSLSYLLSTSHFNLSSVLLFIYRLAPSHAHTSPPFSLLYIHATLSQREVYRNHLTQRERV